MQVGKINHLIILATVFFALVACKPNFKLPFPDGFFKPKHEWEKSLAGRITAKPEPPDAIKIWLDDLLLKSYPAVGKTNHLWDEDALKALRIWKELRLEGDQGYHLDYTPLRRAITAAKAKACDDPLIGYLDFRFVRRDPESVTNNAAMWERMNQALRSSDYPPGLKFYSSLWTAGQFARIDPKPVSELQRHCTDALNSLNAMATNHLTPESALLTACLDYWWFYRRNCDNYLGTWAQIDDLLSTSRTNSYARHCLKGIVYIEHAWVGRTSDWARNVTAEQWELFADRLDVAERELVTAWYLDPTQWRPPTAMLKVELGQAHGRKRMERWFQRAMTASPYNGEACINKLHYLQPRWHGSKRALLAFGRECRDSKTWGGTVPLSLANAHEYVSQATSDPEKYFESAKVWSELRDLYDTYLAKHPHDHHKRSVMASYALRCGEEKAAASLLRELGTNAFTAPFGGREKLEAIRKRLNVEFPGNHNQPQP